MNEPNGRNGSVTAPFSLNGTNDLTSNIGNSTRENGAKVETSETSAGKKKQPLQSIPESSEVGARTNLDDLGNPAQDALAVNDSSNGAVITRYRVLGGLETSLKRDLLKVQKRLGQIEERVRQYERMRQIAIDSSGSISNSEPGHSGDSGDVPESSAALTEESEALEASAVRNARTERSFAYDGTADMDIDTHTEAIFSSGVTERGVGLGGAHRNARWHLDAPAAAVAAFMQRLDSAFVLSLETQQAAARPTKRPAFDFSASSSPLAPCPCPLVLSSDWDMLKVLLRTGTISLTAHPLLPRMAAGANRADVLTHILLLAPDLSETIAVRILCLCGSLPEIAMQMLRVNLDTGLLQWGQSVPGPKIPSAVATEAAETTKGRKKKGAVSEASYSHSAASVPGSEKNDTRTVIATPLLLMRSAVECLLCRHDAFSSVLLAEAFRTELSPGVAALLLRLCVHLLRGLTLVQTVVPTARSSTDQKQQQQQPQKSRFAHDSGGNIHLGQLYDEQVRRAVVWAESLIDAHFPGTTSRITNSSH